MSLLPLPVLTLFACTTMVGGKVTGEVPDGANVVLLWPDGSNLGRVAGVAAVDEKGSFDLRAVQPDNQHTGVEFGTFVLYDGEPRKRDILGPEDLNKVLGAAPQHYMADSNATCGGAVCKTDDDFNRGLGCARCDDDGACKPVDCAQVEVIATDAPLGLDWKIPDVEPMPAVFTEADQHVAVLQGDTIDMFPLGGPAETVFRTDETPDGYFGVHYGTNRVAVRRLDAFGVPRASVRDFQGVKLLELDDLGLTDGPLLSPDGAWMALVYDDAEIVVFDLDAREEWMRQPLPTGVWTLHWSPDSDVVYALPEPGGMPEAMAVLTGAVPDDYPECIDAPPSPVADPCGAPGLALVGHILTQPVLLQRTCDSLTFEDAPRNPSPVASRLCQASGTGTPTVAR